MGVPCITVRDNTERPVTVDIGTNILASTNFKNVEKAVFQILNGRKPEGKIPEFWDGKTAERIVRILVNKLNQ